MDYLKLPRSCADVRDCFHFSGEVLITVETQVPIPTYTILNISFLHDDSGLQAEKVVILTKRTQGRNICTIHSNTAQGSYLDF